MPVATALTSVDLLLRETQAGERANLAFLGGEPLIARDVIRAATRHAAAEAARRNVRLTFSITTNGSLINEDDARFFEEYGFAVTVSLDGLGPVHDRLRSYKSGRGSFDRIMSKLPPLLERQRMTQVSARVTVTPENSGPSRHAGQIGRSWFPQRRVFADASFPDRDARDDERRSGPHVGCDGRLRA